MSTTKTKTRWIPAETTPVTRDGIEAVAYVSEAAGRFYAVGYSGKKTNHDFNGAFRTWESREKYLDNWFTNLAEAEAAKLARKETRKALSARPNPFKVGDILHYSWGYDQTNAEFWQVVEVKAKSVVIREIGHRTVDGSEGFMSERVMPHKDHFLEPRHAGDDQGKPLIKLVQWTTWRPDPEPYLTMDYGTADLITEDSTHYSSWYA